MTKNSSFVSPAHHPFGEDEPVFYLSNGAPIPRLGFGLYQVPATTAASTCTAGTRNEDAPLSGEEIIVNAIQAGYRHFDSASIYGNESVLGLALQSCRGILPRHHFFLTTKVWNDAQVQGRASVRRSVEQSLVDILGHEKDAGDASNYYLDLCYIHWPVPEKFVQTYLELQDMLHEGKIKAIGLSNFSLDDYEELGSHQPAIAIRPVINQIEVSPFMYRPRTIEYFQQQASMPVAASKALFRSAASNHPLLQHISVSHTVTPAQVLLRWSFQKDLVVLTKTSNAKRMKENRDILQFSLSPEEMAQLDTLTSDEDIRQRQVLEEQRKQS
jgi:diketogulonate reductase-like aldo/keto reductase